MSNAVFSQGTLFKIGDGGSPTENFTTIAEVTSIQAPQIKQTAIDVTSHDSAGGWVEKIPGLLDGGQCKLTMNFIPTNSTQGYSSGLLHDMVNRVKRNFKIVFPNTGNTTWAITALVTDFGVKAEIKAQLVADVTLDITGQPTLA